MNNTEFFTQLTSDPIMKFYSRATIQAIVSNVELSFDRFIDSANDPERFRKCERLIKSAVENWKRISKTFDDINFPDLFIGSAIHAYSGKKVEFFFEKINVNYDPELSKLLKTWLPENYRRGCPVTDPRITKRKTTPKDKK